MMKNDNGRRNIIYTSNILDRLYNLKTHNIIHLDNGYSYAGTEAVVDGVPFMVGLCTHNYQYHILTPNEIILMEILLSWDALTNENEQEYTYISFKDIDWMRNRQKRNKSYVQSNHALYLATVKSLEKIYLIYGNEDNLVNGQGLSDSPLMNIEYLYEQNEIVGLKYNFGDLGIALKELKQMVSLDMNIFRYSSTEFMKYQILRYMVISIYMNRTKKYEFSRTNKSILKAITAPGATADYYDYIIDKKYLYKYLERYHSRLNEVMESLKQTRFIRDYSITYDRSKRSLLTSYGRVLVMTNVSKKKRTYSASLSKE